MSRNMQWQLFNELKDAIADVLDEFLDEQDFYVRPRLIIQPNRYGEYEVFVEEYIRTDDYLVSEDAYKYIIDGDIDYDSVDELASQFFDLRL